MKLKFEPEKYLKQQEVLTGEMIAGIADHLEEAGIVGDQLKELTGKIAFDIACKIDDVSSMEFDGDEAHPFLMFVSLDDDDELIHFGTNSSTHEMVYGILNAMFKEST